MTNLLADFLSALSLLNVSLAFLGVMAGIIIGALPGLSATMAVAVLVPFTFSLNPSSALIVLGAIYTGAIFGGSWSAILINTPGTPSAVATTFDGYAMAKKGDGDLAMSVSCMSSFVGGMVGVICLALFAPPLASISLAFGPTEYFWLAMLGLTLISTLAEGDNIKSLIGACLGLLLSMIGVSVVGGDMRLTGNISFLNSGIEIVSAMIGLFCIPVILDLTSLKGKHLNESETPKSLRLVESFSIMTKNKFATVRGALIGTFIGILPGAGGSIASIVSYGEAKRTSKNKDNFGKGEPEGLVASETANNATVGGGFIPTLCLGIPGTPPDAVILGALLIQGIKTGNTLFTQQSDIVYTFIFGLALATLIMLPLGLLMGRYAYKFIIKVPKEVLIPSIIFLTIIGSYSIENSILNVYFMFFFGLIGWVLNRAGFKASPIVLGLVLGSIAEQGFVQAYIIGNAQEAIFANYFGRPISIVIIFMILVGLFYPTLKEKFFKKKVLIND